MAIRNEHTREVVDVADPSATEVHDLAAERSAAEAERARRRKLVDEIVDMSQEMNLYEIQAAERVRASGTTNSNLTQRHRGTEE